MQGAPAVAVVVELAALRCADGGDEVLEEDARAGRRAARRHADVLGGTVLEGGLLGGAGAGGLVLARLLRSGHFRSFLAQVGYFGERANAFVSEWVYKTFKWRT